MRPAIKKDEKECKVYLRPVRDVIDLIGGKWRLPILVALSFGDKKFTELERALPGISPRMLSKELKDLELNLLVSKKAEEIGAEPTAYHLTDYGKSLDAVIQSMRTWGTKHRAHVMR